MNTFSDSWRVVSITRKRSWHHLKYGNSSRSRPYCRSQWPRGLRRGSATARLLGLRVGIPPGAWISVSCVWRVLSGREVSASGWSLVQESPTKCGVSECVREASTKRRPWPTKCCCAMGRSNSTSATTTSSSSSISNQMPKNHLLAQ
jgi:hypothetical protein